MDAMGHYIRRPRQRESEEWKTPEVGLVRTPRNDLFLPLKIRLPVGFQHLPPGSLTT